MTYFQTAARKIFSALDVNEAKKKFEFFDRILQTKHDKQTKLILSEKEIIQRVQLLVQAANRFIKLNKTFEISTRLNVIT